MARPAQRDARMRFATSVLMEDVRPRGATLSRRWSPTAGERSGAMAHDATPRASRAARPTCQGGQVPSFRSAGHAAEHLMDLPFGSGRLHRMQNLTHPSWDRVLLGEGRAPAEDAALSGPSVLVHETTVRARSSICGDRSDRRCRGWDAGWRSSNACPRQPRGVEATQARRSDALALGPENGVRVVRCGGTRSGARALVRGVTSRSGQPRRAASWLHHGSPHAREGSSTSARRDSALDLGRGGREWAPATLGPRGASRRDYVDERRGRLHQRSRSCRLAG